MICLDSSKLYDFFGTIYGIIRKIMGLHIRILEGFVASVLLDKDEFLSKINLRFEILLFLFQHGLALKNPCNCIYLSNHKSRQIQILFWKKNYDFDSNSIAISMGSNNK